MFTHEIGDEMGQILGVHAEPNHPAMDWEPHAHFQLNVEHYVNENSSCYYQCRKTGTPEIKYTIKC